MPAPCCHRSACACSVVECIALILPGGWVGLRARNGAEAWAAVTAVAVLRDATGYSTNPALTWPCSRMAREVGLTLRPARTRHIREVTRPRPSESSLASSTSSQRFPV